MPNVFTVRVELHNADKSDYVLLHSEMEKAGFSRTITDIRGKYWLPESEYITSNYKSGDDTCKEVSKIASKTGKKSSILVTFGDRYYLDLKSAK